MRIAILAGLVCSVGALGGCGASGQWASAGTPGGVQFVSSSPDAVLLDFVARPPGGLAKANESASQQCHMFHRGEALLESLNVRDGATIRASYVCGK
jgi:hypothetical protein